MKLQNNNFIYKMIDKYLSSKKNTSVRTRFPPEPNGYLHIGHAKSICLNFGIAQYYYGECNLRFDDTNPVIESKEYIDAIKYDIKWLGFQWDGHVHYASDYYEALYLYAIELISKGLAYVDELSVTEIKQYRGTLTKPGNNSPYRTRSIKENLSMFSKMRKGYFAEGTACLRAKIDMSSPFMVLRDPVLYRIRFVTTHHNIDKTWCIFPMYDFTHCISDAIEGITHSLCTLEFQDNRRLYNWVLDNIEIDMDLRPRQYEFSRLNIEHFITSKRKLNILVKEHIVDGWDDPRMPTISGLRRRGYTPTSIREFCRRIGITKQENKIKIAALESCIRNELNEYAPRVMAVIDPITIIIDNLPINYKEYLIINNHPYKPEMGSRNVIFTREIVIDKSDFVEDYSDMKNNRKLIIGGEVKLRHAYIIVATSIEKNINGDIIAIHCNHDPNSIHKHKRNNQKIKGIIHWVSAVYGVTAEFRLYNHLFKVTTPMSKEDFLSEINPDSLIIKYGLVEPEILNSNNNTYQFEREGYFCFDKKTKRDSKIIFNRIVKLTNK